MPSTPMKATSHESPPSVCTAHGPTNSYEAGCITPPETTTLMWGRTARVEAMFTEFVTTVREGLPLSLRRSGRMPSNCAMMPVVVPPVSPTVIPLATSPTAFSAMARLAASSPKR
jgi:hypothetical protein